MAGTECGFGLRVGVRAGAHVGRVGGRAYPVLEVGARVAVEAVG